MRDYAGIPPWTSSLYTPSMRYDGKYLRDLSDGFGTYEEWTTWVRGTFDSLLTVPSPCSFDIAYNYITSDSDSVYVGFDLVVEDSMSFNSTLRVGVTESQYPSIPTGKWRHIFRDWMKDDLPDSVGWSMGPMFPGEVFHFEVAYDLLPYDPTKVSTFIFLQRNGTRKIQQGWGGTPEEEISGIEVADGGESIMLGRNAPNPFTTSTEISYSLANSGKVRLGVYTLSGRFVTDLVDGYTESGRHSAAWDGRDRFGNEVAAGVYYFILETGDAKQVGKMIRLR